MDLNLEMLLSDHLHQNWFSPNSPVLQLSLQLLNINININININTDSNINPFVDGNEFIHWV